VDVVKLFYRDSSAGSWRSKNMSEGDPDHYSAVISAPDEGYGSGTNISFYVEAADKAGNEATARSTQVISVVTCVR
jgi:hypothetical protein